MLNACTEKTVNISIKISAKVLKITFEVKIIWIYLNKLSICFLNLKKNLASRKI